MKNIKIVLAVLLILVFGVSGASAVLIDLYDWAFNLNGTVYRSPDIYSGPDTNQLPNSIDDSGFDWSHGYQDGGGIGTIKITYDPGTAGTFFVFGFFDIEIDESLNTYFNEGGGFSLSETPAAGQSWEIDDPFYGDIVDHVYDTPLDNLNEAPAPLDDVSMAMGWSFDLSNVGDKAIMEFVLGNTEPTSGFYLGHRDPDSGSIICLSSTLDIQPIPEPGTILLVGTGLAGLAGWRRRRS